MRIEKTIASVILMICFLATAKSQKIEAAYSQFDDQLTEWKLHINEDDYVDAQRQFGLNLFNRWNFQYYNEDGETINGFMEVNRQDDLNYWDLTWNNEHLSIETVYRGNLSTWKITHGDKIFIFEAKDRSFQAWEKRSSKGFNWELYVVNERDIRDWYIDDESSEEELTLPMRVGAIMIVIEVAQL